MFYYYITHRKCKGKSFFLNLHEALQLRPTVFDGDEVVALVVVSMKLVVGGWWGEVVLVVTAELVAVGGEWGEVLLVWIVVEEGGLVTLDITVKVAAHLPTIEETLQCILETSLLKVTVIMCELEVVV